jgi:hypothetical protein
LVKRLPFAFGLIAAIIIGCLSNQASVANSAAENEFRSIVVSHRTLTAQGGRVDWCASNNLIAFDRMTGTESSEVFVIRPDGSGERCITCNMPDLPKGIRGQPAWHPSGEFLVIQVQGKFYKGNRFEFVSWGIHNDLWLIAAEGKWAQRIVETEYLGASLHPHFSDTGDRLFWTVRESTGKKIRQRLFLKTPGKENPWDGWHLAIADFKRDVSGKVKLTQRINITESPATWEKHGEPSPGGSLVTFNSSRSFDLKNPLGTIDGEYSQNFYAGLKYSFWRD